MIKHRRSGPRWSEPAIRLDSADVRQRQRELDGCDLLGEMDAADWQFGFVPPEPCECPFGRCPHQPEVVKLRLRPGVAIRRGLAPVADAPERCDHGRDGISRRDCLACVRRSRPERAAA